MTSVVSNKGEIVLRPARLGDGQSLYDVTARSIQGLGKQHYSDDQLAGWMGERTAEYYETMIEKGKVFIAEERGEILGFVDADPGEVTRLFLLPEAAGLGLGARLLKLGVAAATKDHSGPVRVESTLNAQGFYERHGFKPIRTGHFSHGVGGDPIKIVLMEMNQGPTEPV
ncbi:GNAT family N-acetyltransferase [Sinirhodobacter populi]|uniref:GNAT family N-acetyltransferase n=1 Tax=Paenirhodobacter populi TaxID=2306993 RepID=A0A443IRT9_9RHOB|nr:GNAT family N-acetyltransferase [Sinirhodobacter populi]RWR09177.1 GNAT family N-acetyltransferase [Sinirhodobacter populi]RWR24757.1 GNAT family N-acetyltransferase [Sinirhodobacter populi]RWR25696.1 GNAT family N-acetyltransferase [Sinirhodobacter populi]